MKNTKNEMNSEPNSEATEVGVPEKEDFSSESSNIAKEIEASFESAKSIQGAARDFESIGFTTNMSASLSSTKAIQEAARALESTSLAASMAASLSSTKAIQEAAKAFSSTGLAASMAESFSSTKAIQEAAKAFSTKFTASIAASLSSTMAVQDAVKAFKSSSTLESIAASLGSTRAIQEAVKSFKTTTALDVVAASLNSSQAIQRIATAFADSKTFRLSLQALTASLQVQHAGFALSMGASVSDETDERSVSASIQELEVSESRDSFINAFCKLNPALQMIILFIFLHVILPQVNSISANFLTSMIQETFSGTDKITIIQGRYASELWRQIGVLDTSKLRFITRNNVRLRTVPNTSPIILDELPLGHVVTVLRKNRNWIMVQYVNEENEVMRGWVFTRYTSKFKH